MLYGEEVAVCSEINTKHNKHRGGNLPILSFKLVGASDQQALEG